MTSCSLGSAPTCVIFDCDTRSTGTLDNVRRLGGARCDQSDVTLVVNCASSSIDRRRQRSWLAEGGQSAKLTADRMTQQVRKLCT